MIDTPSQTVMPSECGVVIAQNPEALSSAMDVADKSEGHPACNPISPNTTGTTQLQEAKQTLHSDDEFDDFDLVYNSDVEQALRAAEQGSGLDMDCQSQVLPWSESCASTTAIDQNDLSGNKIVTETVNEIEIMDIEDTVGLSPLDEFRHKGFLSVTDLAGPAWCEVQYDYRMRTQPFLPPSQRLKVIKTPSGAEIPVDQVKVEDKERVLKRGQKIHKRLEREIHPEEIVVTAETREDAWGLRILNMICGLEELIRGGKCRELPVVGFVRGVLVLGIIDEINRVPIEGGSAKQSQGSPSKKGPSSRQTSLDTFLTSPSKPRPKGRQLVRTHKLLVSDSKTRTRESVPQESDTLCGRLQLMIYKELLDALLVPRDTVQLLEDSASVSGANKDPFVVSIDDAPEVALAAANGLDVTGSSLPTDNPSGLPLIYAYLELDTKAEFSNVFVKQSRPVVTSNGLRYGAGQARTLEEMTTVFNRYVEALGLGTPPPDPHGINKATVSATQRDGNGVSSNSLELVYRRAAPTRVGRDRRSSRKRQKNGGRKGRRNNKESTSNEPSQSQVINLADSDSGNDMAQSQLRPDHPRSQENSIGDNFNDIQLELAVAASLETDSVGGALGVASGIDRDVYATLQHGLDEDEALRQALALSLAESQSQPQPAIGVETQIPHQPQASAAMEAVDMSRSTTDSDCDQQDDELAMQVEMQLASSQTVEPSALDGPGTMEISVRSPLREAASSTPPDAPSQSANAESETVLEPNPSRSSGSIIGRTKFQHDRTLLAAHLDSVLGYWHGQRAPNGVPIHLARRCGWCEFEEGCEWRQMKANEAMARYLERTGGSMSTH